MTCEVREMTRMEGRVSGAMQYTSRLWGVSRTLSCVEGWVTAVLAGRGV